MASKVQRPKISIDRVMQAVSSGESAGFCLSCGNKTTGVEPDARDYPCDVCGANKVYGAEEVMLMF